MAGPTTTSTGQIVPRSNGQSEGLAKLLQGLQGEIARALPKHISGDRMARIVLTALRTTPKLAICTPQSFAGCVMQLAQLGLEPNTPLGHAYLIPREDRRNNRTECTALIGYQGFIELARRSGLVSSIYAYAVRKGDKFSYRLGLDPNVEHEPSDDPGREDAEITHVYAVAKMRDSDERVFVVLTKAQVEKRRLRSSSATASFSPWKSDYEAMALKSAIRALWKWLPKSTEIARAVALDDGDETGKIELDPEVADVLAQRGLVEEAQIVDDDSNGNGSASGSTPPPPIVNEDGEVQQSLDTSGAKRR